MAFPSLSLSLVSQRSRERIPRLIFRIIIPREGETRPPIHRRQRACRLMRTYIRVGIYVIATRERESIERKKKFTSPSYIRALNSFVRRGFTRYIYARILSKERSSLDTIKYIYYTRETEIAPRVLIVFSGLTY